MFGLSWKRSSDGKKEKRSSPVPPAPPHWGESLKVSHMGVSTAAMFHIGFLSSSSRELSLTAVKSSSSSTRLNSCSCDNFLLPIFSQALHPYMVTPAFCTHTALVHRSAHKPPMSNLWGRKHSASTAGAALQTLELGKSWSPCVYCLTSLPQE